MTVLTTGQIEKHGRSPLAMLQQNKRDDARLFLENGIIPFISPPRANSQIQNSRTMSNTPSKTTAFLKLICSWFKSDSTTNEQIDLKLNSEENELNLETPLETPVVRVKSNIDLITAGDRPVIGEKNKWLYPTDNFGKMEHGVADDNLKNNKEKRITFLD